VRYVGSSTYTGWQVVEAEWVSRTEHLTHFVSAQNQYNLLERDIERDLVPACERYDISIIPYFPLASGFLTGKYRPDEPPPEGTRLAGQQGARQLNETNFASLAKLEKFAQDRGHTMVELAMGWLATRPYIASIIAGASKPEQVEENVKAVDWRLTPEEMAELDEIMGVQRRGGGMGGPPQAQGGRPGGGGRPGA
jgi:aryl-alcohol dehydrogenase-like predicted oxidoreductase